MASGVHVARRWPYHVPERFVYMAKQSVGTRFFFLLLAGVLIAVDQVAKSKVLELLRPIGRYEVIGDVFSLTYVENRGAAFGILQGQTQLLAIVTGAVLVALVVFLLSGRMRGMALWALTLIFAGGAGNLIDRIYRGYVVDYLDFSALFGFPVFNFADCCVVVGTFLLLLSILLHDRAQANHNNDTGLPEEPAQTE